HASELIHFLTSFSLFLLHDTASPEFYTLSLHDALPIWSPACARGRGSSRPRSARSGTTRGCCGSSATPPSCSCCCARPCTCTSRDRKSTRLNSSHVKISYAVFCLKKKKEAVFNMQTGQA